MQFTNDDLPNEEKIRAIFLKDVNTVSHYNHNDRNHILELANHVFGKYQYQNQDQFLSDFIESIMYCLKIDSLGKKKRCIRALIRHSCQSLFPELIFYHKHVSLFDRSVSSWMENHIQSLLTKFSNDIDPEIGLRWLA